MKWRTVITFLVLVTIFLLAQASALTKAILNSVISHLKLKFDLLIPPLKIPSVLFLFVGKNTKSLMEFGVMENFKIFDSPLYPSHPGFCAWRLSAFLTLPKNPIHKEAKNVHDESKLKYNLTQDF